MGVDGALLDSGAPLAASALGTSGGASQGLMLAVVGAKGGCGTTLLAANLAAEMASTRSVCLVDLQFTRGDVAGSLDLAPAHSVHDALAPGAALNAFRLHACAEEHASGLAVLTQPYDLVELVRVDAEETDHLLGVASQAWTVVVADCGAGVDETMLTAMRRATCVLLVLNPSIPALRGAVRMLGLLRRLGVPTERVRLVVNAWQGGLEIDLVDIEEQLGLTLFTSFTFDPAACRAAEARGLLLSEAAPKARLTRELRVAAAQLLSELDQLAPAGRYA